MNKEDLIHQLEQLNPPAMESNTYANRFRTYLLNTRRSAILGLLLLVLPFLFVLGNLIEYVLKLNAGIIRKVIDLFIFFDQYPGLWFLGPLLLMGGPLLAVLLNLFSILHVHYEKKSNEVIFSLKVKWLNIMVLLVCVLIVGTLFLYLVVENT